jgi:protein-tyrosine phosphatase
MGDSVEIESAGTIGYHSGALPDKRMRQAAATRGYQLDSRARQVRPEDFERFDWVVAMDMDNQRDLKTYRNRSSCHAEIKMFTDYCKQHNDKEVPDPYYGGADGFDYVLDLLEDGCEHLLDDVRSAIAS